MREELELLQRVVDYSFEHGDFSSKEKELIYNWLETFEDDYPDDE